MVKEKAASFPIPLYQRRDGCKTPNAPRAKLEVGRAFAVKVTAVLRVMAARAATSINLQRRVARNMTENGKRARRAWTLVLMVALIGIAFVPTAGEAQAATLMSLTLVVQGNAGFMGGLGCGSDGVGREKECSNPEVLTSNTFTVNSKTYTVTSLDIFTTVDSYNYGNSYIVRNWLSLILSPQLPDDVRNGLTLRIDSKGFPLNHRLARHWTHEQMGMPTTYGTTFEWLDPRLSWGEG